MADRIKCGGCSKTFAWHNAWYYKHVNRVHGNRVPVPAWSGQTGKPTRARRAHTQEVHMRTLWAVKVFPFEQDPYSTIYLFTDLIGAQHFADKVNDLPVDDRIFLCGGPGSTVSPFSIETTSADDAFADLATHYWIEGVSD